MSSHNNPLDGILSEPARKALGEKITQISAHVKEAFNGHGEVKKGYITKQIDKSVDIVLADLDGADGSFDGTITKETLARKGQKVGTLLAKAPFSEALKGHEEEIFKLIGDKDIVVANLSKTLKGTAHKKVDKLFSSVDKDNSGGITQAELKEAIKPKHETIQLDPTCDGTCTAPTAPNAKPKSGRSLGGLLGGL